MGIQVSLLNLPVLNVASATDSALVSRSTEQNQTFQEAKIQNGYGTATTVSVSPGFGATVTAYIKIEVDSITQETFNEIKKEVKKSNSYKKNEDFKRQVDTSTYSSGASSSSGFFGWLIGKKGNSYSNTSSNMTDQINKYVSGDSSDDLTVANSVADIMVKNTSKVLVTAKVEVTGQLLVPSPTMIAVESTVFSFTKEDGTKSTVTMMNQTPLVPVDNATGTVSNNILEPGSKLSIAPIGG
ncbi:hypothetical protein IMCC3317_09450 [Kordia antarctica]|uniref:Uncharacterized protein n=1 Tax=Kordia antarctica TaxID=1218801 RepID=A0A7L4ZGQ1_9FLAO|nr:hypothetical protein [Kordia antarctica]QHI35599.1 hypothetical protein IMCC3317_09450 [Kordia antarctica]